MSKILVIGACGQLGSELTLALRDVYGTDNIIGADLRLPEGELAKGPFEELNVLDKDRLFQLIDTYEVQQIYQLAAILSAKGEANPQIAWQLNMEGLINVLEAARQKKLTRVYWPSSIAVFGPHTPKINTPQDTIMDPNTVYGISKLAGERWCEYYFNKYGVDVRSLRYPGLIGYKVKPGGGTTDYAVDIYYKALEEGRYECFLDQNTSLPMMYIEDAIKATIDLMQADSHDIKVRSSYNIGAMNFTPDEIYQEIKKRIPEFEISYATDFRQAIADSWPDSINDLAARTDWGWNHSYNLSQMTDAILTGLKKLLDH